MEDVMRKLRSDWRGYIFKALRGYKLRALARWSTAAVYVEAGLKGVRLQQGCTFYGRPVLTRTPMSCITIGSNCAFRSDCTSNLVGVNRRCILATMREGAEIVIGEGSRFSGTVIAAAEQILVGKGVLCGANVLITDFDWHPVEPHLRHNGQALSKRVIIGDNVWLGVNSIVLRGVKIGKNSVVAANSLVTHNVPANVIAGGNPCMVLKRL
jgi:acetyltransferase-like isoleucine patch superfamily enzyme